MKIMVRTGRLLNFGSWLADNEGFSLTYSKEQSLFKVQTAKDDKFYGQARKLKELRDKLDNEVTQYSSQFNAGCFCLTFLCLIKNYYLIGYKCK